MNNHKYIKEISQKGLLSYTLTMPRIWVLIGLSTLHHIITVSIPFFLIFMMSQLWFIKSPLTYMELGIGFLIIGALWMMTSVVKDKIYYNLLFQYSTEMSTEAIELLNNLPYSYIGNLPIESQFSRFNPLDNLSYSWLNNIVRPLLDLPLIIIAFSIICFILGFTYFCYITTILIIVVLINNYKSKVALDSETKLSDSMYNGTINDIVDNLSLIQSHHKQQYFQDKCDALIERKSINNYKINTKKALLSNISDSITLLIYIGSLTFSVYYTLNNYIEIRLLVVILLLTWFSIAPLKTVLSAIDEMPKTKDLIRQFKSLLSVNKNIQRHKKHQLDESFNGNIVFDNLSFSYGNGSKFLLKSINLSVKRGEILVINGPSGSGKSTILKLITGLIEKSAGLLLIDQDISQIDQDSLNKKVLYLSNDSYFDTESIKNNIIVGQHFKIDDELQNKLYSLNINADVNSNTISRYQLADFNKINSNIISYEELKNKIILSKLDRHIMNKIILLDEPIINEHDNEFLLLAELLNSLKDTNTIVIASRYNFYSPLANKVIMLNNGVIHKQWENK